MRSLLASSFLSFLIACWSAAAAPHPLSPLTAAEIQTAARIVRASPRFPANAQFSVLTLDEPPKDQVLAKATLPRLRHTLRQVGVLHKNSVFAAFGGIK